MKHIMKCEKCDIYTMEEKCVVCGSKSLNPKPQKYTPLDKYSNYRRKAKEEILKTKGLL